MTSKYSGTPVVKVSPVDVAPLISLPSSLWNAPLPKDDNDAERQQTGREVVKALQTSGFLLIQSDLMPLELQQQALKDATKWLTTNATDDTSFVTTHPTDPKTYVMLEAKKWPQISKEEAYCTPTLVKYWNACQALQKCVLRAIGVGLGCLSNPEDLASWHSKGDHSAMRLLHYPPATPSTGTLCGNRCKAHSDYGTVTLLSTDGVSGLEILLEGTWWPVPHQPGAIVVNIGSLLSEWTTTTATSSDNSIPPLLATLHRVAGPASENSASDPAILRQAMETGRTSIAFFADPDNDTPLAHQGGTSMDDYILWRSGGTNQDRSGVAFTANEQQSMVDKDGK